MTVRLPGQRDPWPAIRVEVIDSGQITDLGNITVRDIRSFNWDGGSTVDSGATQGYFLDASTGSAEFNDVIVRSATGSEIPVDHLVTGSILAQTITIGPNAGDSIIIQSDAGTTNIRSSNFVAGSAGWRIQRSGVAEFSDVTVRGTIESSTITGTTITGGTFRTASSGTRIEMTGTNQDRIIFFQTGTTQGTLLLQSGTQFTVQQNVGSIVFTLFGGGMFTNSNFEIEGNVSAGGGGTLGVGSTIGLIAYADDVTNVRAIRARYDNSEATDRVFDVISDQGGAGSTHLFIEANGNVSNTNNSYGAISDRRLKVKASIKPARSYLEDLRRLPVRKYRFKRQTEVLLGFVADEVAEIFPGMVSDSRDKLDKNDPRYQTVKTTVLIPMLVTAVQELADRVERLEAA